MTNRDNSLNISIYYSVLQPDSSTSSSIYNMNVNSYMSSNMPVGDTINLTLRNSQSIIRSVKFYKWAMNYQTLVDIGPYKYSDDVLYNFQINSYNFYFYHFEYYDVAISDWLNACMTLMTTQTQI